MTKITFGAISGLAKTSDVNHTINTMKTQGINYTKPGTLVATIRQGNKNILLTKNMLDHIDDFPGWKSFVDDIETIVEIEDANTPKYEMKNNHKKAEN